MPWYNKDGLNVRFGIEKINVTAPRGEAPGAGATRDIDVILDVTKTTNGAVYVIPGTVIPRNSFIETVETVIDVAVTGATGGTFGLQRYDGTEYDYDGLLTAITPLTIGSKVTYNKGTSGAGALVGTETLYPGVLVFTPSGGVPLTGLISLRVRVAVVDKDVNKTNY